MNTSWPIQAPELYDFSHDCPHPAWECATFPHMRLGRPIYTTIDIPSLPLLTDFFDYPLSIATMSHSPGEAAPSSKYEVIFDEALKTYEKKTGKDLKSDPLLRTLEACKSLDETLSELRQQIPGFDQSEDSDNRLTNWVNPVVNVLYIFAQTIGGAIGIVSLSRF